MLAPSSPGPALQLLSRRRPVRTAAEMALRRLRLVAGGRHSRRPGCRGRAIDRRRRPTFAAGPWPPTWVRPEPASRTASGMASCGRTNGCCRRLRCRRPSLNGSKNDVVDEISTLVPCLSVASSMSVSETVARSCSFDDKHLHETRSYIVNRNPVKY